MRLAVLFGLAVVPALAQSTYPCAADAALEQFHQNLHATSSRDDRIRMARERMQQDPGNLFLHRWYLEVASGQDVVDEYRTLLDKHPGDPAYLFLYGRALEATDKQGAVEFMHQAMAKDPHFPWARRTLARIYLTAKLKDEAKAIDNLKAYIQICPYNLDAYSYLRLIPDREFAAEASRRLRFLVSDRTDAAAIPYFTTLWNTELRLAPPGDQEAARALIAGDLERLKQVDATNNRALLAVQSEGYKLLGDPQGQAGTAAQARTAPPENAAQAVRDWHKEHPHPSESDRAAHKKFARAQLKAADEWVKKYPGEFQPLDQRFVALDLLDASKSELEAAGDALIANEDRRASISGSSVRVHVARVWLRRDIRVSDIPAVVEKGLEREQGLPETESRASRRMSGWAIIAEAYLKLDKPFKAREVLRRMQDWLEQSKNSRAPSYAMHQAKYYLQMAALAEKENSKLDALTYYERAIATRRVSVAEIEKAHAAWKNLGGTNEGWLVFSTPPAGATPAPGLAAPRVTSRADVGKPLPALTLKDFDGKTWTFASFQGKTTLINVWATWCGPCQKELPYLQKLYDKIKDQPNLQVVTLNVDEETERVQPYLNKNKYTFPVLLARTYVKELLPNLSIPRNWIVDKEGLMREETIGFGGSGNQWMDNALVKLRQ